MNNTNYQQHGRVSPITLTVSPIGKNDSQIKVTISDQTFHALVDSGANHSIISLSQFQRLPQLYDHVKFFLNPV